VWVALLVSDTLWESDTWEIASGGGRATRGAYLAYTWRFRLLDNPARCLMCSPGRVPTGVSRRRAMVKKLAWGACPMRVSFFVHPRGRATYWSTMLIGSRKLALAAAAVSLAAAVTPVTAQTVMKVGTETNGVPFSFLDPATQQMQGFMVDLIQAVGK